MDNLKGLIKLNLTDKDGIVVSGTTYKLANGSTIYLLTKGYPQISYDNYINPQENLHTPISLTKTLSIGYGPTKFSGNKRLTVTMDVLIPITSTISSRTDYSTMTGATYLNHYLLYNMWRYPHRIYLKDMDDNTSNQNVDYPINILMNRNDLLNQTIFSTDGMPLVLQSISPSGESYVSHKETELQGTFFEYKLTFLVDDYGD